MKAPVQVQYAFALNRRNQPGDRDTALGILEKVMIIRMSFLFNFLKVLELKENHEPDTLCLCGRIYKDKFVESCHTDNDSRDKAIYW